ncbi:hypothetical protein [Alienimonas sp. DA493]|uniref:hypothetical protein n=1 Tax=Alienimonas sp. DA493 TaxID=3373605 RepID=UPI0037540720
MITAPQYGEVLDALVAAIESSAADILPPHCPEWRLVTAYRCFAPYNDPTALPGEWGAGDLPGCAVEFARADHQFEASPSMRARTAVRVTVRLPDRDQPGALEVGGRLAKVVGDNTPSPVPARFYSLSSQTAEIGGTDEDPLTEAVVTFPLDIPYTLR